MMSELDTYPFHPHTLDAEQSLLGDILNYGEGATMLRTANAMIVDDGNHNLFSMLNPIPEGLDNAKDELQIMLFTYGLMRNAAEENGTSLPILSEHTVVEMSDITNKETFYPNMINRMRGYNSGLFEAIWLHVNNEAVPDDFAAPSTGLKLEGMIRALYIHEFLFHQAVSDKRFTAEAEKLFDDYSK